MGTAASITRFGKLFLLSAPFKWGFRLAFALVIGLAAWQLGLTWGCIKDACFNQSAVWQILLGGAVLFDLVMLGRKSILLRLLKLVVILVVMPILWLIFWVARVAFNGYYLYLGKVFEK